MTPFRLGPTRELPGGRVRWSFSRRRRAHGRREPPPERRAARCPGGSAAGRSPSRTSSGSCGPGPGSFDPSAARNRAPANHDVQPMGPSRPIHPLHRHLEWRKHALVPGDQRDRRSGPSRHGPRPRTAARHVGPQQAPAPRSRPSSATRARRSTPSPASPARGTGSGPPPPRPDPTRRCPGRKPAAIHRQRTRNVPRRPPGPRPGTPSGASRARS